MRYCAGLLLLLLVWAGAAAAEPRVLTSIKPLQLLAAAVVGNGESIDLLLDPRQSHHEYQLRPSDRRTLQRAQVVFWIGPALETFLEQPLATIAGSAQVVALQAAETEREGGHHHHDGDDHTHGDAHFWLDPEQAIAMAHRMAQVLAAVEPSERGRFEANAGEFATRLREIDRELAARFAALPRHRPYMVLHDAYGHFESRYGLQRAATYAVTPEQQPGARHLLAIQQLLDQGRVGCVFREPQFEPRALAAMLRRPDLHTATLDLMASDVPATADGFTHFYRTFGHLFIGCLEP
jgi:zinc transport system substrate-binding protein